MALTPEYAMSVVRAADTDRYLSALYAPLEKRDDLFALYAFNAEIAGIRERVSDALPGEVRLQWWRDVLSAEGGRADGEGNPLAVGLVKAIERHQLPVQPLLDMLDAREFDLYDDPMPSRNDLEGYCGETASALIQLASLILDADNAQSHGTVAGHAGCAQAIAGLLRLLPAHRARGQCYIPADILRASGTSRDALVAGESSDGVKQAIAAMAALGQEHFAAFRQGARALPASLRPAYLPASLAGAYLARTTSGSVNPLHNIASISFLHRHWLMLKGATRGWA